MKKYLLTVLFIGFFFVSAHAQTQALSHLGQPIVEHIALRTFGLTSNVCPGSHSGSNVFALTRFNAYGTPTPKEFNVPGSKKFVITDIKWDNRLLSAGSTGLPGVTDSLGINLDAYNLSGQSRGTLFFSERVTVDSNTKDAVVGGAENILSGIIVGPGVVICPSGNLLGHISGLVPFEPFVEIRGYLIPKN